jgi:hypothetical protein
MAQWTVPIKYESGEDCKALVYPTRASGKQGDTVRITIEDEIFSVTNMRTLITIQRPIIQRDYIDYDKIIPKNRDDRYTHINPSILTMAIAGFDHVTDEPHTMKISMSKNEVEPIILSADKGSVQFTGLVLPVRIY